MAKRSEFRFVNWQLSLTCTHMPLGAADLWSAKTGTSLMLSRYLPEIIVRCGDLDCPAFPILLPMVNKLPS